MSAPARLLYQEENVLGKGIGCIAIENIKKGTLVIRERPQLLVSGEEISRDPKIPIVQKFAQIAEGAINCFLEMSREDQENYMKLHNTYASENWSRGMATDYRSVMHATDQMTFPNISKEKAFKVWGIYKTNAGPKGVCLKVSRFNHSCRPNAEWFWNEDTNTVDVRAVRKIKSGEEITLRYIQQWAREERRAELQYHFNFDCNCEACDLTEEQIQAETESIAAHEKEQGKKERIQAAKEIAFDAELHFSLLREEVECQKQIYRLAKRIKTMDRRRILDEIVERGFALSCSGALGEQNCKNRKEIKASWLKDAKMFANIGLDISKTLHGEDHSWTRRWQERDADPMKIFLRENVHAIKEKKCML